MMKRATLIPICLSFFAGAIMAGFFSPRMESAIRNGLAGNSDRPLVQTGNIKKIDTPFTKTNTSPNVVMGTDSPLTEGDAGQFLKSMSAHVYYDPPYEVENLTFLGPDGNPRSLADHKGRYLLLNAWATWCGYCLQELPSLQRLQERYKGGGLDVVAVSVDTSESIPSLGRFLKNRGIGTVAQYYDDRGDIQYTLPVNVLPVSFLIDPEGRVIYSFGGATDWSSLPALAFLDRYVPLNQ